MREQANNVVPTGRIAGVGGRGQQRETMLVELPRAR